MGVHIAKYKQHKSQPQQKSKYSFINLGCILTVSLTLYDHLRNTKSSTILMVYVHGHSEFMTKSDILSLE